jgi:hemoglobin
VDRSLYDRLGGTDAIMAVVRAVVDRQVMDDRNQPEKFARANRDRLFKKFVDHICQAAGGRCDYTGNRTQEHHKMGVTDGQFQAFVERRRCGS